jgi:putative Mn2+ efflux pump MntP
VILIGVQAFVVAQLGLRLGARLGESIGERAETIAALALIALGVLIVIEQSA